jgi:acetyltransferase
LAILGIGAASVPAVLREAGEAGVKNVIVWAGGFAEGGPQGAALQAELVDIAAQHQVNVLGPNCLGVFDTAAPLTASFASFLGEVDSLLQGGISMIGQSGGLTTNAMAHARESGFGFRYAVSTGNEAVLDAGDFVAAMADDPLTKVIALYIEGARRGAKLAAALAKARDRGKPVVMLRGGVTAAAARAAAAHTGALAGESRVWQAVLDELAVIQVQTLEELLDVAKQISSNPNHVEMAGSGIAVVTFGGGSGVLSADQAARRGLAVPALLPETRDKVALLIPPIASTVNPIDLTPQTYQAGNWLDTLPEALDLIAADLGVDGILLQYGPMAMRSDEVARITKEFIARAPIPVLLAWELPPSSIKGWLADNQLGIFEEFDRAVRVLAHFASTSKAKREAVAEDIVPVEFDWAAHVPNSTPGTVLSEYACHALLEAAGIPVAVGRMAQTPAEAVAAAAQVGLPVAVKGMSQQVTHKFAAGLVRLNLDTPEAVQEAAEQILARIAELGAVVEGVYVQHMEGEGVEILVSALRDPVFGTMVSVGAGGVMTELLDDVALRRAPIGMKGAEQALRQLQLLKYLDRKHTLPDITALASLVSNLSRLAASAPWKRFVIEMNPVKWHGSHAAAVDGLLIIEEP